MSSIYQVEIEEALKLIDGYVKDSAMYVDYLEKRIDELERIIAEMKGENIDEVFIVRTGR